MKNPAPQSARGSNESWKILHGSLAVFNVEQVALNRHEQYFKDNVRVYLTANTALSTRALLCATFVSSVSLWLPNLQG